MKPQEKLIKIGSKKTLAWNEENNVSLIKGENKNGVEIPKITAGIIPIKNTENICKRYILKT